MEKHSFLVIDEKTMLANHIDFTRLGGLTKRYHTKHVNKENNVAAHSFGVAWMVYFLTEPNTPLNPYLLMSALAHDLAEQVTGDISSPTKRKFPELAAMVQSMEHETLTEYGVGFELNLTDEEKRTLKLADCLDGALYCISEVQLGNRSIMEVYNRYMTYIQQLEPTGRERLVYSAVRLLMREHAGE